ncbi:MAG: transporter substrate-binding domain-containing protein, partial [Clostridiales bacterium]|nr:transporter substrate-binding domain-containing protein [Clostridiales bacterium]
LVVGTSADYPPFEFHAEIDGVDTIVGVDIMIAQYFADKIGVELRIEEMAFDALLISLDQGMFDLVLAGMSPNDERRLAADFTDDNHFTKWVVMIRKADEAKYNEMMTDFKDAVIGIQKASVYGKAAVQMSDKPVVELVKFVDLIIELQNGKIDAVVANQLTSEAYVSGNPDLMVKDVNIVHDEPGQAAAVQKGNPDFVEYLNGLQKEMKESGAFDRFLAESVALANASGQEIAE